jgi:hypothetical protein
MPQGVADTSFEFDGMAGERSQVCSRTLTTERWSYICAPYDMPSELYDLQEDPAQTRNVIEEYPEVAKELQRTLIEFLEAKGAPEPGIAPFRKTASAERKAREPAEMLGRTPVYLFGRNGDTPLGTTDGDEAKEYATALGNEVEATTLGELYEHDPRALVRTRAQYYWTKDLMTGLPQGSTNELKAFTET